jgi:hypothetical protein
VDLFLQTGCLQPHRLHEELETLEASANAQTASDAAASALAAAQKHIEELQVQQDRLKAELTALKAPKDATAGHCMPPGAGMNTNVLAVPC